MTRVLVHRQIERGQAACAALSLALVASLTAMVLAPTAAVAQTCGQAACPIVKVVNDDLAAACRAWATEAVGQMLENEQLSCGATGEDWHFDIKRHFRICRGLSPLDREQYSAKRQNKLRTCRTGLQSKQQEAQSSDDDTSVAVAVPEPQQKKPAGAVPEWDEYCRKSYLKDALRMARFAEEEKCTDAAAELHLSQEKHYDFCVREAPKGAGDYPLHDMIGERQEKIDACIDKSLVNVELTPEINRRRRSCSRYADVFLNAMLDNKRLACEFTGDDWHNDWNKHYSTCTELDRSKRLQQMNERQSRLRECREKVFPEGQLGADEPGKAPDVADDAKLSEVAREACGTYAKEAVAHEAANQQLGCGFSGDLWDLSEDKHKKACEAARADFAFQSNITRDGDLRQCTSARLCKRGGRAKTQYCQDLTGRVPRSQQTDAKTDQ